jgi:hypothetical protein
VFPSQNTLTSHPSHEFPALHVKESDMSSSSSAPVRRFVYVLNGALRWSSRLPSATRSVEMSAFEHTTVAALLTATPKGAYTGMIIRDLSHVLCWEEQLTRINRCGAG